MPVDPAQGPDAVLALAAAVEQHSEHPLGRAITRAARDRGLTLPPARDFRALPGRGVTGIVEGSSVTVERGVPADEEPGTVVAVRVDGSLLGHIRLVDQLRPDAPDAVAALGRTTGNDVHLLTGDNYRTAADVARATGIGIVHAELLPQDKTRLVSDLQEQGRRVLLVGDGVNDAPALAQASTGIAMGRHGSDLALETADAIVVRDELSTIPHLVSISRRARRYVVANLTIAAVFITVLVTWDLVATLPLPLAVAGHEGSTVIVALNGLRLLRRRAWTG
jgi:P-type E1-E2 ATPase